MTTDPDRKLLIEEFLDGTISAADALNLEAELAVDPAFRRQLYERLTLETLLEEVAGESADESATQAPTAHPHEKETARPAAADRSFQAPLAVLLTLAACLLAAFLLWPAENGPDGAVA
ncbi:MAG: hypothetical protein AAF907_16315, partial [Planctomycetota bacterium]